MEVEVRAALEKFRRGDDETAFFELIEMPGDVLTGIIDVFHAEPRADIRAFLVKAAWERREETVIPLLRDPTWVGVMAGVASAYGRRDGDEALRSYLYEVVGA